MPNQVIMKLEPNFSRFLGDTENPRKRKIRHELYIFLVCLVISVIIWFLIAISKEVYTSLEYPVQFSHPPADMVLVNKPDSILTFRIASGGFESFTLRYLSRKKPIEIDLRNISLEKEDEFYTGVFNTARLSSDIRNEYRFSEELISISPENIYFRFEPLTGKSVPVVSNLKLAFQKQFRLADTIVFDPPEVKVIGPKNLMDRITMVKTEAMQVAGIEGTVSGTCGLIKPLGNEQITLVPDQVNFTLNAERFTESTIIVPVHPSDDRYVVKSYPENVNVTFLVSLSNFKRVDAGMFQAVIDIPQEEGGKVKASVRLAKAPAFVEVTRIEPSQVDFLVLKK